MRLLSFAKKIPPFISVGFKNSIVNLWRYKPESVAMNIYNFNSIILF